MPEELTPFNMLHRLWTKAVGTSDYDKREWKLLERAILRLQDFEKIQKEIESLVPSRQGKKASK